MLKEMLKSKVEYKRCVTITINKDKYGDRNRKQINE